MSRNNFSQEVCVCSSTRALSVKFKLWKLKMGVYIALYSVQMIGNITQLRGELSHLNIINSTQHHLEICM